MPQQLFNVMTENEIVSYINENPNLTYAQMQDLAGRIDVSNAAGDKATVFYTGPVDAEDAYTIANGLVNQHGDLGIIDNTEAKTLFANPVFRDALQDAINADPNLNLTLDDALYNTDGGMWSIASENLASQASGDVVVIISPEAEVNRVFGQNMWQVV